MMGVIDRIIGRRGNERGAPAVQPTELVGVVPDTTAAAAVETRSLTPAVPAKTVSMTGVTVSATTRSAEAPAQRHFKAAESGRLTVGLPTVALSPDQISLRTLRTLRARSRYEVDNSDIAKRAISLYDTGVIGLGINLYGQVVDENGEPDEASNKVIEQGWRQWCKSGSCELTGMSFWDVQRLFEISNLVDGEALYRLHVGPQFGPWGFQVELVDPELMEVEDNRQLPSGNWVRMGIEYDSLRRPVAYWVTEPDPRQGLLSYGYNGRRRAMRMPIAGTRHAFMRERVGQSRGTPRLSNCLLRLAHLDGAEDAALVNLRIGASKVAWLKNDGTGRPYTGDDQGWDTIGNAEAPAHRVLHADVGSMGELPPGWDVKTWDPAYPNNEYGPFQKRLLQNLGSGLDLPYFELGNDLEGVNYSSAKIGQMTEHDTYQKHQEFVIQALCWPVFNVWLETALMMGFLRYPSGAEMPRHKIEKFRNVRFQPRTWEGADRLKDVTADVLAVEACQMTLTDVIRKRSGRDLAAVVTERSREIALMTAAGIPQSPALNEALLQMAIATGGDGGKGNAQNPAQ